MYRNNRNTILIIFRSELIYMYSIYYTVNLHVFDRYLGVLMNADVVHVTFNNQNFKIYQTLSTYTVNNLKST